MYDSGPDLEKLRLSLTSQPFSDSEKLSEFMKNVGENHLVVESYFKAEI